MRRHESLTKAGYGATAKGVLIALLLVIGMAAAHAATTVRFATPPWPGANVKTRVAGAILEAMGYRTTSANAGYEVMGGGRGYDENSETGSWAANIGSIGNGFKDVDLATWMPMESGLVNSLVKSGKIKLLVANVPQAQYDLVVPDYVWEAGVHCICDLQKYADRFGHRIYGIERGNEGNQIVKDAIQYNTYGLGRWQLTTSDVTGMLDSAQKLIKQHKWVVFLGWKPHWMNTRLKIHYLKDPQNLWHMNETRVYTAINTDFMNRNPNVVRFLKQMVVGSKLQSRWIDEYGYQGIPADKVAARWIRNNLSTVGTWLQGVKTADGKAAAIDAVKAKFAS